MMYYFNLIPLELNNLILLEVGEVDPNTFNKFKNFIKSIDVPFSYENLLKLGYPGLYISIKDILRLGIKLFEDYDEPVIFCIIYTDILKCTNLATSIQVPWYLSIELNITSFKDMTYQKFLSSHLYDEIFNNLTISILRLISMKGVYTTIYNRLGWFPVYNSTLYALINFSKDIRSIMDSNKKFDPVLKDYLLTGIIKSRIVVDSSLHNFVRYDINLENVIIFLLVNEYIRNKSDILFDSVYLTNFDGIPESRSDEYVIYMEAHTFYDNLSDFTVSKRNMLKYIS